MIIDYVLQPGIQLVLGLSVFASLYLLVSKDKIDKNLDDEEKTKEFIKNAQKMVKK